MAPARIVLHLPKPVLSGQEPLKHFYQHLRDGLSERGAEVAMVPHDRTFLLAEVVEDTDFHIVDHGDLRHPRILNAGIAYLFPFWNLDPHGIRALSSIGEEEFRRQDIDGKAANLFFRYLVRRWVTARRSRGWQPNRQTELPEGAIAVFLQCEADRMVGETRHLDREAMVAALLARDDPRPIVIKPHPRDTDPATEVWLDRIAASDRRVTVTKANIHDILSRAALCVTINSAVGIEAMLHRVPVILCGRADFHHAAVTVRNPRRMDDAITEALSRPWPHVRYLYWYFRLNCIDAGSPTLIDDTLAKIARTGFDTGSFGIRAGTAR